MTETARTGLSALGESYTKADGTEGEQEELRDFETLYFQLLQERNELREAERKRVQESSFKPAKTLPPQCWVSAVNAMNFFIPLKRAREHAIDHHDPWRKIYFDVSENGELKAARLEGTAEGKQQ